MAGRCDFTQLSILLSLQQIVQLCLLFLSGNTKQLSWAINYKVLGQDWTAKKNDAMSLTWCQVIFLTKKMDQLTFHNSNFWSPLQSKAFIWIYYWASTFKSFDSFSSTDKYLTNKQKENFRERESTTSVGCCFHVDSIFVWSQNLSKVDPGPTIHSPPTPLSPTVLK